METRGAKRLREQSVVVDPSIRAVGQMVTLIRPGTSTMERPYAELQLGVSTPDPRLSRVRSGPSLVCQFCQEEQVSLDALEFHTLGVHGTLGTQVPDANTVETRDADSSLSRAETAPTDSLNPTCCVCQEIPRMISQNPSILQCDRGHLLCSLCAEKVLVCPLCRSEVTNCRNLFAEAFVRRYLLDKPLKCRHLTCNVSLPMCGEDLPNHEKFCNQREGSCLAAARGKCNWWGPLTTLFRHMKEERCVQILMDVNWDHKEDSPTPRDAIFLFEHQLNDFPLGTPSVYERSNVFTSWKPILLLGKGILPMWCHLVIQRDRLGNWKFMVFSKLQRDCVEYFRVKISVGNKVDEYSISTKILSIDDHRDKATQLGSFLGLTDLQVQQFHTMGVRRKLFDFKVEIKPCPSFLERANSSTMLGHWQTPGEATVRHTHHEAVADLDEALAKTAAYLQAACPQGSFELCPYQ
jgi:hypothetical protein